MFYLQLTLSCDASLCFQAAPAVDFAGVRKAIESYISENEDMGPTLVRLAWHASGTYDMGTKTGGSNGASMRFSPECAWGANKGLGCARDALAKIKQQHPGISYADLWTLAGAVAIEYMGGPKISWRSGRSDAVDGKACPPDGRLPAADKGCPAHTVQHIRDIFYRQGFNDQEIVALIGAHSLGRCHTEASGYSGPWTRAPTTFSNMYFKELLDNTWTLKKWSGPDQFEDPTGQLMMLPSDMAFIWDKNFREWAVKYRDDKALFFEHFAAAWTKLTENGVKYSFLP
jgi:cytochrome c peroxidase